MIHFIFLAKERKIEKERKREKEKRKKKEEKRGERKETQKEGERGGREREKKEGMIGRIVESYREPPSAAAVDDMNRKKVFFGPISFVVLSS